MSSHVSMSENDSDHVMHNAVFAADEDADDDLMFEESLQGESEDEDEDDYSSSDDHEHDHEHEHDHHHHHHHGVPDDRESPESEAKKQASQTELRKLIVAIQKDASIPAAEKAKRIQVCLLALVPYPLIPTKL